MPPADQVQRLDPGQWANEDPLNPANDFLAVGLSLQILQIFYALENNNWKHYAATSAFSMKSLRRRKPTTHCNKSRDPVPVDLLELLHSVVKSAHCYTIWQINRYRHMKLRWNLVWSRWSGYSYSHGTRGTPVYIVDWLIELRFYIQLDMK